MIISKFIAKKTHIHFKRSTTITEFRKDLTISWHLLTHLHRTPISYNQKPKKRKLVGGGGSNTHTPNQSRSLSRRKWKKFFFFWIFLFDLSKTPPSTTFLSIKKTNIGFGMLKQKKKKFTTPRNINTYSLKRERERGRRGIKKK